MILFNLYNAYSGSMVFAKSPALDQSAALQSRMLISESNDSMAEVCEADKQKVIENAAKGRVEA